MATVKDTIRELNEPIKAHYHEGDREPRLTLRALAELENLHTRALELIRRMDKTIVDSEQLFKRIYDQKREAETRVDQQTRTDSTSFGGCGNGRTEDNMTIKVFDVTKFQSKLNSYVCWNEHLSKETINALKTVNGWLNDDACMKVVSMEEHERLLARFRHLMESPYIRSFDQVDIKTGAYKRDIRLAIGPDEKLMENGLDKCPFCGGEAEIITKKRHRGG